MKTGKVAQIIGKDPKTVLNWATEVEEYLSEGGSGRSGGKQRDFDEADLVIINTINDLREKGVRDWEEIRNHLRKGKRNTELPPGIATVDTGQSSVVVVQRAMFLSAENERLLNDLAEAEETIVKMQREHKAEVDELREKVGLLRGYLRANGIEWKE